MKLLVSSTLPALGSVTCPHAPKGIQNTVESLPSRARHQQALWRSGDAWRRRPVQLTATTTAIEEAGAEPKSFVVAKCAKKNVWAVGIAKSASKGAKAWQKCEAAGRVAIALGIAAAEPELAEKVGARHRDFGRLCAAASGGGSWGGGHDDSANWGSTSVWQPSFVVFSALAFGTCIILVWVPMLV